MKKYCLFITFLLIVYSCKTGGELQQNASKPLENSLLWKIEKSGNSKVSYLFGTIHIISESKYFFTPAMNDALKSTSQLVLEIDMHEIEDPAKAMEVMQSAYMPGDTTLRDLLSKEDYEKLDKMMQEKGLPLAFFDRIEPLFISAFLMEGDENPTKNSDLKFYEFELMAKADSLGIPVAGIESVSEQMDAIKNVPLKVQAGLLVESLNNPESSEDTMLQRLYTEQKIDSLALLVTNDANPIANYMDVLLKDRNERWISRIDSLVQAKSCFIAVGSGHLGGQEGVIRLLRKNGFKVTAVK